MGPQHLRAMERWNLIFSGLAILIAAFAFDRPVLVGVALGSLIACTNFWAIRKIWESLLSGKTERRQSMQTLFVFKMIALFAVVFLCLRFVDLSPAALAVGLSIFLLSIVVQSARFALGGHVEHKP